MARAKTPIRYLSPDPIYQDIKVTRLINYVMQAGKRKLAMRIVYKSFELIKEKTTKEPLEVFLEAVINVTPTVEVKARRIGGANIQVPILVRERRKDLLALSWILSAAKTRRENSMAERLAYEIIDASNEEGAAIKKKSNMDRSAQSHKHYSHLR